jgi:hypothetical protein
MRALPLGIGLLLASGCGLLDSNDSNKVLSITLAAVNSSGETGTAVLSDLGNDKTQVSITTSGGTDTGAQSAVVRKGTCGSNGSLFEQLNNIQSRQSVTTLSHSLSSLKGSYYIDVHSSTSVDVIVACGEID